MLLTSCVSTKPTIQYFSDCEKSFSKFEQISSCGFYANKRYLFGELSCE